MNNCVNFSVLILNSDPHTNTTTKSLHHNGVKLNFLCIGMASRPAISLSINILHTFAMIPKVSLCSRHPQPDQFYFKSTRTACNQTDLMWKFGTQNLGSPSSVLLPTAN